MYRRDAGYEPTGVPPCEGGYPGLIAMGGNAREWLNGCEGDGGACMATTSDYESSAELTCGRTRFVPRDGLHSDIGIRCCSE